VGGRDSLPVGRLCSQKIKTCGKTLYEMDTVCVPSVCRVRMGSWFVSKKKCNGLCSWHTQGHI
jgi:hypothetical protein